MLIRVFRRIHEPLDGQICNMLRTQLDIRDEVCVYGVQSVVRWVRVQRHRVVEALGEICVKVC